MKVNMEVLFNVTDICDAMLDVYKEEFGDAPIGYHLVATKYYDEVKITTVEDENEKPPTTPDLQESK